MGEIDGNIAEHTPARGQTDNKSSEPLDLPPQIHSFTPLLTGGENRWTGIQFFYLHVPLGEIVEEIINQSAIAISTNSVGIEKDRWLDGRFEHECCLPQQCLLMPEGSVHRALQYQEADWFLIGIEPAFLSRIALETFDRDRSELMPQFAHNNSLIFQLACELKNDLSEGCPAGVMYGEFLATTLATYLLRHYAVRPLKLSESQGGLSKQQLKQIVDYIQARLDEDIKLTDLADLLKMDSHYFWKQFKKSMGIAPHQYTIRCRIDRAKYLLTRQKKMTIAEIALECGFAHQSHFTRHFRKWTGTTPKAFRDR